MSPQQAKKCDQLHPVDRDDSAYGMNVFSNFLWLFWVEANVTL